MKMTDPDKTQIQRVLILGNKGFVGQHIEKRFLTSTPKVKVMGKDLPNFNLTSKNDVNMLTDLLDLDTAVIMLAAIKRQFGDSLDVFNQNLSMTTNLCGLLRKHPVGRFVFFSSAAVYGEDIHNTNIMEETHVYPTSYYGMVKFISERLYWKALGSHDQTSLVILRPPTIYGPGDEGGTYGPVKFMNAAINKDELILWGDGTELRDYVFIDDVAEIVFRLTYSSFHGVLNLASGVSYSFRDVLDTIESISGRKLSGNSRPRTKAKVDNVFSNDRLMKEIGRYSFTPLPQGIRALYEHLNSGV